MLRRLGVRGKILATLAVPIFVLALAASWITWQSWRDSQTAEQTAALMRSLELQDVSGSAVAEERGLNIGATLGLPGAEKALPEAQEATSDALAARDEAFVALDTSNLSANVQDKVARTIEDSTAMDQVQRSVAAGQITETRATDQYSALADAALDVPRSVAQSATDEGMADRINAYVALDEALLANTLERPLAGAVLAQLAAGETDIEPDLLSRMVSALQTTDTLRAEAQQRLDALPGDLRVPAYDDGLQRLRLQLRYLNFSGIEPEAAEQWGDLSQAWVEDTHPVRDQVRDMAVSHSEDLARDAQTTAWITALAAFGVVVGSFLLAITIARRIVEPLRRLTNATAEVRDRLPQMVEQMAVPGQAPAVELIQVPVESGDEIGHLADSFNDVNETTMIVAREQAALRGSIAEMFVNVARRDQVLLNRQLAFLDELERSEEDPGTLSNLFRLDHLATRMRRNAESLLVLAGIDSGRRVRNPMPISDVVRTASSEIELYDRIRLDLGADPHMLGHNALNAAHLIAELLENATMFSEPHTPVEVRTSRDERGVVVVVRDLGLGMSPEELEQVNAKVARTTASDAVGAQHLGLFVVSRLAERLGASVAFAAGSSGVGTEVEVVFPAVLFLPDEALPLPQPTDPLEAETQAAADGLAGPGGSWDPTPAEQAGPADETAEARPFTTPSPVASSVDAPEQSPFAPAPAASGLAEPEPPVAVPVDLDALTDGTTSLGMPRRRRATEPAAGQHTAEEPGVSRADTGPIMLPPLEAPSLPDTFEDDTTDLWRPPSAEASGAAPLPSRGHARPETTPTPASEPDPTSAPVIGVEQRTGLFSGFRSMGNLDVSDTESTLQLDAVTEDPATVPDGLSSLAPEAAEEATTPDSPFAPVVDAVPTNLPARDGSALPTRDTPADTRDGAPRDDAPWMPEPAPSLPRPEERETVRPVVEPVPEPVPSPMPEPVELASAPTPAEGRPASPGGGEPLPAFEDLMADLPTRRGAREAAGRKRGLFGRKPSSAGPAPAPERPAAAPAPERPAEEPAPAERGPETYHAPRPVSSFGAPPAPAAPAPAAPAAAPAPDVEEPRPSTSYGGSVLPLRSTEPDGGALDVPEVPDAPDSVEARSEWMASAVLYEEMSSLLERGVFQEGNVTSTNDEPTYHPATLATEGRTGLARRARGSESTGATDHFAVRIDRDPEQLRARLSAFQSATSRGRTDADAVRPSTTPAPTVNDVPGSSPQQR